MPKLGTKHAYAWKYAYGYVHSPGRFPVLIGKSDTPFLWIVLCFVSVREGLDGDLVLGNFRGLLDGGWSRGALLHSLPSCWEPASSSGEIMLARFGTGVSGTSCPWT